MLKECGVVAENNRKRKREKETEKRRKQRAKITTEKNAHLLKCRNNYAAMPDDKKNSLLQYSREKSHEEYTNLAPEEKDALLLKSQEKYATMPNDKKNTPLQYSREKYATMPRDEKDTLLLHSREKYANLTPEERAIKLRGRRETYGKIKCTIKREALLAQMRETTQRLRDAYTIDQMLRVTEQNALRQRQIRLRGTSHNESTHQNMPAGRKCNIDNWNLSSVRYFDVGGLNLICYHCSAEGFVKENKGKDLQPQNINFGKLCCNKGKCVLSLFPPIPGRLKELYTSLSCDAKYFRQNIRLFNSGMSPASVQVL